MQTRLALATLVNPWGRALHGRPLVRLAIRGDARRSRLGGGPCRGRRLVQGLPPRVAGFRFEMAMLRDDVFEHARRCRSHRDEASPRIARSGIEYLALARAEEIRWTSGRSFDNGSERLIGRRIDHQP